MQSPDMHSTFGFLGIPKPQGDELLSSAIARAAVALAEVSPKGLNSLVFGKRTVVVSPDLQSGLDLAADFFQSAWDLDVSSVIANHTLLKYYTHHVSPETAYEVGGGMLKGGVGIPNRLGICTSNVRVPTYFQMCRMCVASDVAQKGFTFLRRAHHLPGVLICPKHEVPLSVTSTPFRPMTRHTHNLPHISSLVGATDLEIDHTKMDALLKIARDSNSLLHDESMSSFYLYDYRERFKQTYRVSAGQLFELVRKDLVEIVGERNLALMFKSDGGAQCLWLKDALHKPRRPLHPLKHILIKMILEYSAEASSSIARLSANESIDFQSESKSKKTWGLYRRADLRLEASRLRSERNSLREIGRQLAVDVGTVKKLLAPLPALSHLTTEAEKSQEEDRNAWLALIKENPELSKTQIRLLEPALYTRLYRSQRDWLSMTGPAKKQSLAVTKDRRDWKKRDALLAKDVEMVASRVKTERPHIRASISHVLGLLLSKPLFEKYADKLPLTKKALESHAETVEQFHFRRLADVLSERDASISVAFREARINQYRYEDSGLALYMRVKSYLARRPTHT